MSTDARDARILPEEGFHEIQLSGKQLVFLFMATTVVSVVIFLCGVLVGRGVRGEGTDAARNGAAESAMASDAGTGFGATAGAPVVPATSAPADDAAAVQAAEPPAATAEEEVVAGSNAHKALTSAQPPPETVSAPGNTRPAETPAAVAARAPKPDATPASAPPAGDGWVVQVTALRQRPEAQAIAARLVNHGYKAFVLDPQPGAATALYRVRVGPFSARADAEQTMKRLAREEQFNPWISR